MCDLCSDTGYMVVGGRLIPCVCPAGNRVYWQERQKAAEQAAEDDEDA